MVVGRPAIAQRSACASAVTSELMPSPPAAMPKNLAIVDAIAKVAERHGVSNAQIALAWLLAQGDDIVPIPGVKRSETMRDSVRAPDVNLSEEDLAALEAAAPSGKTAGPRYAKAGMARVNL